MEKAKQEYRTQFARIAIKNIKRGRRGVIDEALRIIVSLVKPKSYGGVMKRKLLKIIVGVCLMLAIVALPFGAACAGPAPTPGPSEQTVFELKMQNGYPSLHRLTPDAFHWWGKEIENRTNGRIQMIWFDANTLAKGPDAYEAIRDRVADGGTIDLTREDPMFDLAMVTILPYKLQNSWQGSPALWELYQWSPEMQKMFADSGIVPIWEHITDVFNIHTHSSLVKSPGDAEGQILYAPSSMLAKLIEIAGSAPVTVPYEDTYTAMERGMLTGLVWPWAPLRSAKLVDSVPYHTVLNISMCVWGGYMNQDTWDSFPSDIQDVFTDLSLSMSALCGATLTNEATDVQSEMKAKNHTFYEPVGAERDEWVSLTGKPIEDDWLARVNPRGWDGQAHIDKLTEIAGKYKDNAYGSDDWWGLAGRVWLLEK